MALGDPIEAFLRMASMRNQNKREEYQDIAGIGQGLGQGLAGIGQANEEKKKQQAMAQLLKALSSPQANPNPVQGPQGYVPPGAGPSAVPAGQSPMMQNSGQMAGLAMQADPSTIGQLMPALLKQPSQPKQASPMSQYQTESIDIQKRRLADQEVYQTARKQLQETEMMLRKKGLNTQAARVRAAIADMDAKHPFMYGMGMMESPSEAAEGGSGGGGNDPLGLND